LAAEIAEDAVLDDRLDLSDAIGRQVMGVVKSDLTVVGLAEVGSCADSDPDVVGWTATVDTLEGGLVRVVNRPPPDAQPTWTLENDLLIGTVEGAGPASFGEIKGVGVLPNGGIAILDSQAQEVRVFLSDGEYIATHGGPGQGPGEFVGAHGLMVSPSGELWVPDGRGGRMTVLHPFEGFVSSFPMRLLLRGYVWEGVMADDGRVLKPSITLSGPRRNILRVYDATMTLVDSIPLPDDPPHDPEDPPGAFYFESPNGRSSGYRQVPFYASEQRLLDPTGAMWSTAAGDPSYRIQRWRPGGDTTLVIESEIEPIAVTPTERDSVVDMLIDELRPRNGANQDWSKIPDVKPAVAGVFMADDGALWVRTPSRYDETLYDVYEPDGRYRGTAVTRWTVWPWLRPIVKDGLFYAVVTNELDVPFVLRARLEEVAGAEGG
jgi:hypothetical protein